MPTKTETEEIISRAMSELGRRGGKSTSKKKRAATKKSLEKARAALKKQRLEKSKTTA